MNFYQYYRYERISHPINGQGKVNYFGVFKYSGEWKNGMKIGEGKLKKNSKKFRVKIKHGHIHKCTKVLQYQTNTKKSLTVFEFPALKIVKVGANYKEEYSDIEFLGFSFKGEKLIFDGKAYPIDQFVYVNQGEWKIYWAKLNDSMSTKRKIVEIKSKKIKFYGYCLNLIPNGDCKIVYNDIIFKGNLKGNYFKGPCLIKYPEYKITLDTYLNIINFPIKVFLKSLNTELLFTPSKGNSPFNIEGSKISEIPSNYIKKIQDSIKELSISLNKLTTQGLLSMPSNIISYLFVVNTDWESFEQNIEDANNSSEYSFLMNRLFRENDEKCMKKFEKNERYEGIVQGGKFEGYGKYFYADGSVYLGEFKNNLRNGLGTFKFKDGRVYRGYWIDNLMHGKGCMINGDVKVSGIWEKNQIKPGNFCSAYDRSSKVD